MNKDTRTDEQLNRIIAEWMGWTVWECQRGGYLLQYAYKPGSDPISGYRFDMREEAKKKHTQILWKAVDPRKWAGEVPYYTKDLNAIHEAEKKLNPCDWQQYSKEIRRIIQRDCNQQECYIPGCERAGWIADIWLYGATARQRAEALVAVIESTKPITTRGGRDKERPITTR